MSASTGRRILVGLAIAVVVIAVVGGIVILGPPGEERSRRLDARRVEDLRGIAAAADRYWNVHGELPASSDQLARERGTVIHDRDPISTEPYDYRVVDPKTYELCAVFERDSQEPSSGATGRFWSHGKGRQCFRMTVREVQR